MTETWDGLSLFVTNVKSSRSFYEKALGFVFPKPMGDGGTVGFREDLKLGLYDRQWQKRLGWSEGGAGGVVFSLRTEDIEASYERLAAIAEVCSPPQPQDWGAITFWFQDLDGYRWEIWQPLAK
jgi:catechol 2,3-dioxygenase-like lactoylglutathione lyase family enzyme